MGKIRVKTFGNEEQEQEEQKKLKEKREQKTLRHPSAPLRARAQDKHAQNVEDTERSRSTADDEPTKVEKKSKGKGKAAKKIRSKSYLETASLIERNNKYSVAEALDLLGKLKRTKFDETVELHLNTVRTGQFGTVMLPHGTGKKVRVAIADPSASSGQVTFDKLLNEIEQGRIDFDILIATPDAMPKLASVARVLGPKGLMPNPKNGTIAKDPKETAKQFESGQLTIKTESKFPIAHITVGKVSFGKEKLSDNISAIISAVKAPNIKEATIKSTMSQGIKINAA